MTQEVATETKEVVYLSRLDDVLVVPAMLGTETYEGSKLFAEGIYHGDKVPTKKDSTPEMAVWPYRAIMSGTLFQFIMSTGENRIRWQESQVTGFSLHNFSFVQEAGTVIFELDNGKVAVIKGSTSSHLLQIRTPELGFTRTWSGKLCVASLQSLVVP